MLGGCVSLLIASEALAIPPPRLPPNKGTSGAVHNGPGGLELERTAGGGFRHRDRTHGFEAIIESDGTVVFRDISRLQLSSNVGNPQSNGSVAALLRGSYAPQQSVIEETGNPRIDYGPYGAPPILLSVGTSLPGIGEFGAGGGRGRAKQDFLRRTEDLRGRLSRSAERRRIVSASLHLGEHLVAVWHDKRRTPQQRRATLFALWDEVEEAPARANRRDVLIGKLPVRAPAGRDTSRSRSDASTRDRVRTGELARRRIESFIRQVAPVGSPEAFTAAELAKFNTRRTSRQPFAPYRRVEP